MKPSGRFARVLATVVGAAVGLAGIGIGLWSHDWWRFVSGLALLFFVAVLGEKPWSKRKEKGRG